ncbi:MAG: dienelactone hydrolase family protein [Myxococcota bacterium]
MRHIAISTLLLLAACAEGGSGGGKGKKAEDPVEKKAEESEKVAKPASQPEAQNTSATALASGLVDEAAFKKAHALTDAQAPQAEGEMIEVGGAKAYLSLPDGDGPHPGVVVIHEWWGLNQNIKYWTDRMAALGYAAVAVDLYGGKVATDPENAAKYMKSVDQQAANGILTAAHAFLRSDERVKAPKVGSMGWCFGGGQSLQLALADSKLDAAVMYYGFPVTDAAKLKVIEADILALFGGADDFIPMEQVEAFEKALKEAGVDYELHVYEGATHAFANPSNPHYDMKNASDAFEKTKAFLAAKLKG